jgi:hypothetical protein
MKQENLHNEKLKGIDSYLQLYTNNNSQGSVHLAFREFKFGIKVRNSV